MGLGWGFTKDTKAKVAMKIAVALRQVMRSSAFQEADPDRRLRLLSDKLTDTIWGLPGPWFLRRKEHKP